MPQKTIAILVNTSWNIYNFRMNIVNALTDKGYKVLCIAPKDNYSERLIAKDVQYVPVSMQNRGVNPIQDFLLCIRLWKIFKQYKPDVVLQFTIKPNIYGSMAAGLLGIPTISNVSGLGTVFLNNKLSSRIAMLLYRMAFRFPFKVFFQNQEDQKLFIDSHLVKGDNTALLPGSGVNLQRFVFSTYKRQIPFVFLMASRLIIDKGLFEYLEACSIVKAKLGQDVECWLQGSPADSEASGITKDNLKEVLSQYPVRYFSFTDSIEEFIKKADVLVLPSYREGLARVLLESAALGKPLIATNVAGCREVVKNEFNGLLCNVKDAGDLSRAMIALYEKSEIELQLLGKNSRALVEKEFSDEIVSNIYLRTIEEALKKK
ncbi:MAG TPA: glycosyltransferase family 4 protein [Cytophagaceae bacterium]|jgi:glycosyltransferase involved in cell wall biosynthesis|nr:glycosyltransferase family 4 protein [Cytophagaceae bacterium]